MFGFRAILWREMVSDEARFSNLFERLKRDRVIRLFVTDPRTRRTAREKADKLSASYKRARANFSL